MTRLTSSDGHELDAYEVHPDGASASVVIVQEIFGVNAHIRSVVDRYASFGYRAIAPALFDRASAASSSATTMPARLAASSW
jgi:carboxymethylenebutenolidase